MPFHFPFMPYNYNNYYYRRHAPSRPRPQFSQNHLDNDNTSSNNQSSIDNEKHSDNSKETRSFEDSECFFELFGLRLHFDDVLIICVLFFLYNEQVHDTELFLCLVLLLLS